MAQIILTKNGTGSAYPKSLAQGELAINVHSGSLFYGTSGSSNVVSSSFVMHNLHLVGSGSDGAIEKGNLTASGGVSVGQVLTLAGTIDSNASSGNNSFDTHIILATDKSMAFGTVGEAITGDGTNMEIKADGRISITGSTGIDFLGPITASGDISGSLTSTGSFQHIIAGGSGQPTIIKPGFLDFNPESNGNGVRFTVDDANLKTTLSGLTEFELNANRIELGVSATQHVTASGNISSSGLISAENFHVPGQGRISFDNTDTDDQFIKGQDSAIIIDGDDRLRLRADDTIEFENESDNATITLDPIAGHMTASGNISASGHLFTNRKFVKTETVNDHHNGDILYFGGGSTTKGDIVYMTTAGQWASAQADSTTTSTSMLGIALGTDPDVNGVLIRGTYTLDHDVGNNQGVPLYLSDGTAGQATATAPDSAGDVVRIIGYNLGDDDEIWFDPDKTWVELT